MKTLRVPMLLVALALIATPGLCQEMDAQGGGPEMDAFVAAITPGANHEYLAKYAGTWSYTSSMWQAPGQEPMKSQGKSVKSMVMEGRYLQEEMTGEMMGQPFQGRGLTGFDNIAQGIVGTWIDNFGTGIINTTGTVGESMDSHEMSGSFTNPMTSTDEKLRMVTRIVDADRHVFEYYVTVGGQEVKQMEIEYVREK